MYAIWRASGSPRFLVWITRPAFFGLTHNTWLTPRAAVVVSEVVVRTMAPRAQGERHQHLLQAPLRARL